MPKSPADRGDALMKKASKSFAKGDTEKAHEYYGSALAAYAEEPEDASRPRRALAHYTRALLVLKGDAAGDAQEDIDAGEVLVKDSADPDCRRFYGLFEYMRLVKARLADDFAAADRHLMEARSRLKKEGKPIDLFECEREAAALAADRNDWDEAEAASRRAILAVEDNPPLAIRARIALSEIQERRGDTKSAYASLEAAASTAYDFRLKSQRMDLDDRLRIFRENHPEVAN